MSFVKLDQEYKLKYDFNAIADLEERTGVGVGILLTQEMGFASIRGLLWAGMKFSNKYLTIDGVGTKLHNYLANGGSLEDFIKPITTAFKESGLIKETEIKNVQTETVI